MVFSSVVQQVHLLILVLLLWYNVQVERLESGESFHVSLRGFQALVLLLVYGIPEGVKRKTQGLKGLAVEGLAGCSLLTQILLLFHLFAQYKSLKHALVREGKKIKHTNQIKILYIALNLLHAFKCIGEKGLSILNFWSNLLS